MVSSHVNTIGRQNYGAQNPSGVAGASGSRVESPGEAANISMVTNGASSSSEEPDKKRPRLDSSLACYSDLPGSSVSEIRTVHNTLEPGAQYMSVDSGIISDVDCLTVQSKNVNIISSDLSLLGETTKTQDLQVLENKIRECSVSQGANKAAKPGLPDKSSRTVFDIIVQHNITAHLKKPQDQCEDNSDMSERNLVPQPANVLNSPNNMNTQESAARLSELRLQAYKDWLNCLRSDNLGNIPLHKAVLEENLTLVKRYCVVLCARKADLDVHNNDKETPLHLAVLNGNVDMTQMLLSYGAKPSVKDGDGNTALHLAIMHGNMACVSTILSSCNKQNLPLNEMNDEGYGPLHVSVLNRKFEETKALVKKGADVNLKDAKSGRTPLFHAVEVNSGDLVQFLLQNNASPNEPNFSGHTPLSAASEISYTERNIVKEYSISDGINFSSKLMSLSKGTEVRFMDGELITEIPMDEVPDDAVGAQCIKNGGKPIVSWFYGQ